MYVGAAVGAAQVGEQHGAAVAGVLPGELGQGRRHHLYFEQYRAAARVAVGDRQRDIVGGGVHIQVGGVGVVRGIDGLGGAIAKIPLPPDDSAVGAAAQVHELDAVALTCGGAVSKLCVGQGVYGYGLCGGGIAAIGGGDSQRDIVVACRAVGVGGVLQVAVAAIAKAPAANAYACATAACKGDLFAKAGGGIGKIYCRGLGDGDSLGERVATACGCAYDQRDIVAACCREHVGGVLQG